MEYKIIRLSSGKYFKEFNNEEIKGTNNVLEAKTFLIREIWYQETELIEVEDKLEEADVDFEIMILSYEVRSY